MIYAWNDFSVGDTPVTALTRFVSEWPVDDVKCKACNNNAASLQLRISAYTEGLIIQLRRNISTNTKSFDLFSILLVM